MSITVTIFPPLPLWIFQVHRVLQRTAVGLFEDQPVAIVPDPPDSPRGAALRADGLSGLPQSIRGTHAGLHLGSVLGDERARVHS